MIISLQESVTSSPISEFGLALTASSLHFLQGMRSCHSLNACHSVSSATQQEGLQAYLVFIHGTLSLGLWVGVLPDGAEQGYHKCYSQ